MTILNVHEATSVWLDRCLETVYSREQVREGVGPILGRPVEDTDMGPLTNALERNGHGDGTEQKRGALPRFRVLFGRTKQGSPPLESWLDVGGSVENLKAGYYARVPEGSRSLCWWWEGSEPAFGKPEIGLRAEEIEARLQSIKRSDGKVPVTAIADEFEVEGSKPRDRIAQARKYPALSKRFQSTHDGNYWDTADDAVPARIREKLCSLTLKDIRAQVSGASTRLLYARASFTVELIVRPVTPAVDDSDFLTPSDPLVPDPAETGASETPDTGPASYTRV